MGEWRIQGYSELRVLGEGAQGRVVLARHDGTGRTAAIKYLSSRLHEDAEFRARFRSEAELLLRLRDPHIAALYGVVESRDGAAIVMEAVDGASLKAVLAERGALGPEAALTVLKGSLQGLAAAHGLGIVHRDYKPANVIVRGDGVSKLIDFGIAVDAGEAGHAGTPVYMAPEQWRGEPVSPSTDVYAATCVFFECVTGRRPYAGGEQAALMHRHLTEAVPVDAVPGPLRPLIEQGMAKDPWARPAGAAAFVAELERLASTEYGTQWEQRGVRGLAAAAAAVAALFPLAALGLAPAGAAAVGASGAAGAAGAGSGAAGAAGGGTAGAASGGMAGAASTGIGIKGAAVIAGSAVAVAGGGAAVYVAADEPEPPPLTIALAAHQQTAGPLQVNGRLVHVKGGADPALTRRINAALRAPADTRTAEYQRALVLDAQRPEGQGKPPSTSSVKPGIRLNGPRYLSVRYDFTLRSERLSHSSWSRARTVTVDLKTGKALRAADLFLPSALSGEGLRTLSQRIGERGVETCFGDRPPPLDRPDLDSANVQFALAPRELEVLVDAPGLDTYIMACGQPTIRIPYDAITGLLRPEVVKAIPYPPSSRPSGRP
ncbi:serine/threonine-protein kinase [Actinomadura sp. 9N407]|uniref:serine/threonine-protein kinase n=1 Tax=Actinomadura sp. 9N407 TaxID=3375154 RepID=UPI0037A7CEF9